MLAGVTVQLVYETHAITTDNEAGIASGWLPGRLSDRGRKTARDLGRRRRADGLAVVYVSDLARAIETVTLAFEGSDLPVTVDPRLRECNYGRLNGMPVRQLDTERVAHLAIPWPDGESYADVVTRTSSLLDDVVDRWDGERVLFVAHSANKFALDHLLLGSELEALVRIGMTWQPGWEYEVQAEGARTHAGGARTGAST
jgi:broad specificity phosphatase PhoE